jgi:hypothetical protein
MKDRVLSLFFTKKFDNKLARHAGDCAIIAKTHNMSF